MIISPFTVRIGPALYDVVDRRSLDSTADRLLVKQQVMAELAVQKPGAMCSGIGVPEVGDVENVLFAVYSGGTLLGGIVLTTLQSTTPWDDWRNGAGIFTARPMPSLPLLPTSTVAAIHTEFGHHLMKKPVVTVAGHALRISRLSWAIFKGLTDAQNEKTRAYHNAFANDSARFKVTEMPDPRDATLTRVDAEAR